MANPNIISLTDIRGKTNVANVTTITEALVTNSAGSNTVYKISSLYISNIDGVSSADIVVSLRRNDFNYQIANTISVPADASLIVVDKNSGIYLEEGDSLMVQASANGDLVAVASFEELG
jgi:hypothetical protein